VVDVASAAREWAVTWERAWPQHDGSAIARLYADDAAYRSHPLRDPHPGGALAYTRWAFSDEEEVSCWFGAPIVSGERAAVEWWATMLEGGRPVTLIGTTVLRFGPEGKVMEHRDYWLIEDGHQRPYEGW
jgi:SnoaL-like domain